MPKFSKASLDRLATCDVRLQKVMNEVIKHYDITIMCGNRGKADQDIAFAEKKTKLQWPKSKHNTSPSLAVDIAPCPVDWSNKPKMIARWYHLAGFVIATAKSMGVELRWGGDWDSDHDFLDNDFDDLPHFEIV